MTTTVPIEVLRCAGADPDLGLPIYETSGAAGADLRADLMGGDRIVIAPGGRALVQTGLRVAVAPGYELQVRPRSGLALRHGVTVLNAPGTVDCDYRGPLGVILVNHGEEPFEIAHGMRIAQAVVAPVLRGRWQAAAAPLSETARGTGGFGSTGTG
jgi:dUTP pyrophosphatase